MHGRMYIKYFNWVVGWWIVFINFFILICIFQILYNKNILLSKLLKLILGCKYFPVW